MFRTAFVAAALVFQSIAASAQVTVEDALIKMSGTTGVIYGPLFEAGELTGCMLQFNAVVHDWQSRKGAFDKISGSFGFMSANKSFAPVLKLVVNELNPKNLSLTPVAPTRAYVVEGARSNLSSALGTPPTDSPGGIFRVFQIDPTAGMYVNAITSGTLALRYGRAGSKMDIPVELDLQVVDFTNQGERVRSTKALDQMAACVTQLMKNLKVGE